MTLRGHIHNGAVILDAPTSLPDGTPVSIEPLATPASHTPHPRGSAAAILSALREVGPWDGDPNELDRLLADVQSLRDRDLPPQRKSLE